jgi:hypothetical protein
MTIIMSAAGDTNYRLRPSTFDAGHFEIICLITKKIVFECDADSLDKAIDEAEEAGFEIEGVEVAA